MTMMNRKEELLKIVGSDNITLINIVEDIIFLEEQLDYLRTLPHIKVNEKNKTQQKSTPASKLYKEYLQQYANCIKILLHATNNNNNDEISPLREWVKKYAN